MPFKLAFRAARISRNWTRQKVEGNHEMSTDEFDKFFLRINLVALTRIAR